MAALMQSIQSTLPVDLFDRLGQIRSRYAQALAAAGRGDYARSRELKTVSRVLGHLLAREARKAPEERGGLRMLDITLAVDRVFPELRAWTQYDLAQSQRERIRAAVGATLAKPAERAS